MKKIDDKEFIEICNNSVSMRQAATKMEMSFTSFRRKAMALNCYSPNQGRKGTSKPSARKYKLEDVLNGKYPQYSTYKLKCRLINEGYKDDKCEICGRSEKRPGEKYTPCELHHIDGDRTNHKLNNLILICPNCHSLTKNYRSKNIKR